jgi:hypothetical protein
MRTDARQVLTTLDAQPEHGSEDGQQDGSRGAVRGRRLALYRQQVGWR